MTWEMALVGDDVHANHGRLRPGWVDQVNHSKNNEQVVEWVKNNIHTNSIMSLDIRR